MNWGDNYFAGCDLVDDILIKSLSERISCGSAFALLGTCYLDPLWSLGSLTGCFGFPLRSSVDTCFIIKHSVLHF